ncbi:uncharacterized protein LOC116417694 [Nasonia vitripennis]|uniref:Integrase catalytic domain-containing protein n=1 Tax=Nasonia vitripennis TaxID=7425 RepID=A0A7M7QIL0_NASVI|nr:uncharacterized protein LOC116417694 [Nasonia vitripennis]
MQTATVAKALLDHWITLYGTPLYITSDQGAQFESGLFKELAQLLGAKLIHTTSYHPQSNGMVERFHRTLKAALGCCAHAWTDCLPTVLLGLRSAYKEDLKASPAEMLYGTTLRLPGEFFISTTTTANQTNFVSSLKQLFNSIRPVPASRHTTPHPFCFRDLHSSRHVFKRVDSIRKPLEQPYTGPHRVIKRTDHRTFVIEDKGTEKTVTTDQLKPAYLEASEPADRTLPPPQTPAQSQADATPPAESTQPPTRAAQPSSTRHVTFSAVPGLITGGEVDVATQPATSAPRSRCKQLLVPREFF